MRITTVYEGYQLVPNWAVGALTVFLIVGIVFVCILLIKND